MSEIDSIKSQLVDELWLPAMIKSGSSFYPIRKNKRMRILTLTNDRNYQEIGKLIRNNLTEKDHIIIWNYSFQKRLRLEAYTGCIVKGVTKYEKSIDIYSILQDLLPFDVINLDFSSQDPIPENGRIEQEIKSVELTIKLQREKDKKAFVLVYTTLLNSSIIYKKLVINNSNSFLISGWSGLELNEFRNTILEQNEKMSFIEKALEKTFSKYSYQKIGVDKKNYSLSASSKIVFSIIGIIGKGV